MFCTLEPKMTEALVEAKDHEVMKGTRLKASLKAKKAVASSFNVSGIRLAMLLRVHGLRVAPDA